MRNRKVPVIAAWLLRQFVRGDRSESLLGDLFEEYQAGRAARWYWWETLVALVYSARRGARRFFSRRVAYSVLALIAQPALFVCILALSEPYKRSCSGLPALFGAAAAPMLSFGVIEMAIALVIWVSPLGRTVRANPRSGLVRLSVLAFAAVGFGGGALTWAGTAMCPMGPLSCSPSSVTDSCARRGSASPEGRSSTAQPAPLVPRTSPH